MNTFSLYLCVYAVRFEKSIHKSNRIAIGRQIGLVCVYTVAFLAGDRVTIYRLDGNSGGQSLL
jgi:hypothetical protein